MRLIHYQSLEPLGEEDMQRIAKIKEEYNKKKSFWDRIKLWRKSEIVNEMEPGEARWGFTRVRSEAERDRLIETLKKISEATPQTTWVIFDDGDGGAEIVMRSGRVLNGEKSH